MNVAMQSNLGQKKTYEPIPEGTYTVKLTKSEERATKKGDGAYINATFEVVEGDHSGRLIFQKFLIDHPSAKAVEIGKNQLNKFLSSVGVRNGLSDLEEDTTRINEFTNKLVNAKVKIELPNDPKYKAQNKIVNYSMR